MPGRCGRPGARLRVMLRAAPISQAAAGRCNRPVSWSDICAHLRSREGVIDWRDGHHDRHRRDRRLPGGADRSAPRRPHRDRGDLGARAPHPRRRRPLRRGGVPRARARAPPRPARQRERPGADDGAERPGRSEADRRAARAAGAVHRHERPRVRGAHRRAPPGAHGRARRGAGRRRPDRRDRVLLRRDVRVRARRRGRPHPGRGAVLRERAGARGRGSDRVPGPRAVRRPRRAADGGAAGGAGGVRGPGPDRAGLPGCRARLLQRHQPACVPPRRRGGRVAACDRVPRGAPPAH